MIFTPRIVAAVGMILLLTVVIQLSFFSRMPLLGSVPYVVPVVVISLGLLGGAVTGAVSGFAAGLLLDLILGGTLGTSALALMAAGYLAGRWRETYDIVSSLVPPILGAVLTGVSVLAFGVLSLILEVEAPVSILVLRELVVQGLLGGLLMIVVFPTMRRVLRPALVEDARPTKSRRRPRPRPMGVGV